MKLGLEQRKQQQHQHQRHKQRRHAFHATHIAINPIEHQPADIFRSDRVPAISFVAFFVVIITDANYKEMALSFDFHYEFDSHNQNGKPPKHSIWRICHIFLSHFSQSYLAAFTMHKRGWASLCVRATRMEYKIIRL